MACDIWRRYEQRRSGTGAVRALMKKIASFLVSRMFWLFVLIAAQAAFWILLAVRLEEAREGINAAFWVISLFLALWVTTRDENPAYKIGWIFLILAVPVFGILMYFFFSQRKLGPRQRARGSDIVERARPYLLPSKACRDHLWQTSESGFRQSEYIYAASHFPVWEHTRTRYFPMGADFWESLVEDLRKAEKYIFMEYFIVEEGIMFDTIFEILAAKAEAGVDVRFMYDDIGSMTKVPAGFANMMREHGIHCQVFNPLRPILNSMFNNRDHRKITVIDGRVGYTGGANLADEYITARKRFGTWKDAAIRLEGEAVWSLLVMFLQMWCYAEGVDESLEPFLPERQDNAAVQTDGFVQPYGDSPLDNNPVCQRAYLNLITRARNYVYINTPYLDVGNELLDALTIAAKSGVDVRMTVPHIPDKKMVFLLTKAYYPVLIRAGVKIYEYTPGFIHSKTFVCDDVVGIVGTINLDFRSLYLHWEDGVWLYGTSCLADMKEDYLRTLEIAHEVTYAETQSLGPVRRFVQAVLRVFGPLL